MGDCYSTKTKKSLKIFDNVIYSVHVKIWYDQRASKDHDCYEAADAMCVSPYCSLFTI